MVEEGKAKLAGSLNVIADCMGTVAACALPAWGQRIDVYGGIAVGQGGVDDPPTPTPLNKQWPSVDIQPAGGEYESGTLTVRATMGGLRGVMVSISDLVSGDHVIPSGDVDVVCGAAPARRTNTTLFI